MSAKDFYLGIFTGSIYGLLCPGNGCGRLDGSSQDKARAVAHTAESAAGMVGLFMDDSVLGVKRIIIYAAPGGRGCKAVSDFYSLYRAN